MDKYGIGHEIFPQPSTHTEYFVFKLVVLYLTLFFRTLKTFIFLVRSIPPFAVMLAYFFILSDAKTNHQHIISLIFLPFVHPVF